VIAQLFEVNVGGSLREKAEQEVHSFEVVTFLGMVEVEPEANSATLANCSVLIVNYSMVLRNQV
jgi:hypothetical protein